MGIGDPLLEDGELEVETRTKKDRLPLIPSMEFDVMLSYRRLWGKGPREGYLVDDEVYLQTLGDLFFTYCFATIYDLGNR